MKKTSHLIPLINFFNLPYSILGILIAFLSVPKLKIDFNAKPFAIILYVRSFWWTNVYTKGIRAMAIGNVVLLGPNLKKGDLEHELVHVEQFMRFPIIFPILNFLELLQKGYEKNKFEVEAYSRAGNIYKK